MLIQTLCAFLLAAVPDGRAPLHPTDARAIRAALQSSERILDDRIQQMTARAPFVLLGTTRGAYLAGYGAVFTAEVNLAPAANLSPFRPAYSPKELQDLNRQKREKLGALRTGLRQLLVEQAASLSHLAPHEKIAIVVTLFNFRWEDTSNLPSQLVLQATRQSLLDARQAGPEALDKAIEIREF